MLSLSRRGLSLVGLSPDTSPSDPFLLGLASGNEVPKGTNPWSLCYGGHQFGSWASQLGDGRAISIGEVAVPGNEGPWKRVELQLKGAGLTPYSRFADGWAVLRSSIREYLAAEAMFALGVPTSRSLTLVTGSRKVVREEGLELGAVVCRLAPTWIRFGSFEILYSRGQFDLLKQLADYVIEYHFPEVLLKSSPTSGDVTADSLQTNKYILWLQSVVSKTADMIAHWQSIGFCHGVMNTDNFSILGLTIDYGPYQFMNAYEPSYVCNHSDYSGRYAFDEQPRIALWNLVRLVSVLEPLLSSRFPSKEHPTEPHVEAVITAALRDVIEGFGTRYEEQYAILMGRKLGLAKAEKADYESLHKPLLAWMADAQLDYTLFYRLLSQRVTDVVEESEVPESFFEALYPLSFTKPEEWEPLKSRFRLWATQYRARLALDGSDKSKDNLSSSMLGVNPKYVLRNHIVQQVIDEVTANPASDAVDRYLRVLERPYTNGSPDQDKEFGGIVPFDQRDLKCSCSS
ncbi:hypothetical protein BC830DRAFT_1057150 [Chytriomyces sp. MP71]|nr:hypothetical protein BC830DRAFT_1057150 [Chytriomyces sp. MP71]